MAEKERPSADFPPEGDVRSTLLAAVGEPERRKGIRVSLTVKGGMPQQAYELRFETYGTGEVTCGLMAPETRRQMRTQQAKFSEGEAAALLDRMSVAELVRVHVPMPRIPPDSLVGRLEVALNGQALTIYFMADPAQAEDAGQPPPAHVMRAVDAIYATCSRILGSDWKAP